MEQSQDGCSSKEVLVGEVCQSPTGDCLRCNQHPDPVTTLLPRHRYTAVGAVQHFEEALEFHLLTGAADENTPSRAVCLIDVVDFGGNVVFPQCTYFGSTLRTDNDAIPVRT